MSHEDFYLCVRGHLQATGLIHRRCPEDYAPGYDELECNARVLRWCATPGQVSILRAAYALGGRDAIADLIQKWRLRAVEEVTQ